MPNVLEIVKEHLKKHNYDGLCGDECGCPIDDLVPCDCGIPENCEPAYKVKRNSKEWDGLIEYYHKEEGCEDCLVELQYSNEWFVPEEVFQEIKKRIGDK